MDDLTTLAIHDLETLLRQSRAQRLNQVSADERHGWELGLEFLRAGNLASVRILATRAV